MKVADLIDSLQKQDPNDDIVMKNLYANPIEPGYVMTKIRVYKWGNQVFVDGYDKKPFNYESV